MISVQYEWDKLTEVIVGRGDNYRVMQWTPEYEFAPIEEQEFVKQHAGQLLSEVDPDFSHALTSQLNDLADFLQHRGIQVHRPRAFNQDELDYLKHIRLGAQQMYARDPIIVIGDQIIEAGMRDPAERNMKWPIRELIQAAYPNCHYYALPEPFPVNSNQGFGDGPFLEGGDVMLMGPDVLVGLSGHASNMAGVDWLRRHLGDAYHIHATALHPSVLHLDCALALIKPGLAIACQEAFVDGLPKPIANWDIIPITIEQASFLAANVLVVGPNEVIISPEHQSVIDALNKHDVTVHILPFDAVSRVGGAFRCAHHPLRRG